MTIDNLMSSERRHSVAAIQLNDTCSFFKSRMPARDLHFLIRSNSTGKSAL